MLKTYEAVLKGNQLEWCRDVPPKPDDKHEMLVLVTILKNEQRLLPQQKEQGQRMAKILEQLAAIYPVATIEDPKVWEREMRQDRPLPGRT